jgi:hypothetical protein
MERVNKEASFEVPSQALLGGTRITTKTPGGITGLTETAGSMNRPNAFD